MARGISVEVDDGVGMKTVKQGESIRKRVEIRRVERGGGRVSLNAKDGDEGTHSIRGDGDETN